uniref:Receptor ligand binding region domain-containing protein n=1 Tax=Strigamia maritima TaxID=126957 RepID=T1IUR4_STRMM
MAGGRWNFYLNEWLLLSLVCCFCCVSADEQLRDLHIAGIFPMKGIGGWAGGLACRPAAFLAIDDVNLRTDVLKGYRLNVHWNDSETKCCLTSWQWQTSFISSFRWLTIVIMFLGYETIDSLRFLVRDQKRDLKNETF